MKPSPIISTVVFALLAPPFFIAGADEAAIVSDEPPVDYVVRDAASIPEPLVDLPPGLRVGGAIVFERAGCSECHRTPGKPDAPAIGPDLTGVGGRLTEGEIRLMIVDPRIPLPQVEMPAYYAVGVFGVAPDELVGRTRLSAVEVERLVEWLADLKP